MKSVTALSVLTLLFTVAASAAPGEIVIRERPGHHPEFPNRGDNRGRDGDRRGDDRRGDDRGFPGPGDDRGFPGRGDDRGRPGFPGRDDGRPGRRPDFPNRGDNRPGFPGRHPGFPGHNPGFPGNQPNFPRNPGGQQWVAYQTLNQYYSGYQTLPLRQILDLDRQYRGYQIHHVILRAASNNGWGQAMVTVNGYQATAIQNVSAFVQEYHFFLPANADRLGMEIQQLQIDLSGDFFIEGVGVVFENSWRR